MINSCQKTKEINAFIYECIPTPRDIYRRYGERASQNALFTSNGQSSEPIYPSKSSTIGSLIRLTDSLKKEENKQ